MRRKINQKLYRYDTAGNQIIANKNRKTIIKSVFYMFKKNSQR